MAAHKGPKRKPANSKTTKVKPWEPTSIQLSWHQKWVMEAKGCTEIAREHHCQISKVTVWQAIQKVEEYFRLMKINETINYRGRQVAQLEMMQRDALEAWNKSKGKVITRTETVSKEDDSTVVTKVEMSHGDPAYADLYIKSLKGISDLLGVKAPTESKVSVTSHSEEIPELLPMHDYGSRSAAFEAVAAAFQAKADAEKAKVRTT